MITVTDSYWVMLNHYLKNGTHHYDADEKTRADIENLVKQYPNKRALFDDIHVITKDTFIIDGTTGFLKGVKK